jgi:hypothetical protein
MTKKISQKDDLLLTVLMLCWRAMLPYEILGLIWLLFLLLLTVRCGSKATVVMTRILASENRYSQGRLSAMSGHLNAM